MKTKQFNNLIPYGWQEAKGESLSDPSLEPGRVVAASRGIVLVRANHGELWCTITGSTRQRIEEEGLSPCAGDWILFRRYADGSGASVRQVLPRSSVLVRHAAGRTSREQSLAANIDYVFLVMGLDDNFNPARMERLIAIGWGSGAQPVAVLNKADLVADPQAFISRIEVVAPGVPVQAVSAHDERGVEPLRALLRPGTTGVLVGSSGVGKSTLLNCLAGKELRKTREVRASDSRGRHTTSLRELFLLPAAGCLIDSPGIREVGLWGDETVLDETFPELLELAGRCKFADCAHQSEPGCAVKAALQSGQLSPERYQSYLKLRKELEFVASRVDDRLRRERKRYWKGIAKVARGFKKGKGPG